MEDKKMEYTDIETVDTEVEDVDVTEQMELPIKKSTIVRFICAVVVILDVVLKAAGIEWSGITDTMLYDIISPIYDGLVVLWVYWSNNSFTKKARKGDAVKNGILEVK